MLISLAGVGVVLVVMLLWWFCASIFRGRFQLSIRTLLALTVAVALPLAWLAAERNKCASRKTWWKDSRQSERWFTIGRIWSSAKIESAFCCRAEQGGCRSSLGDDFFAEVDGLILDRSKVTDADLESVRSLPALKVVSLEGTNVTDASWVKNLRGLASLEWLNLDRTRATDAVPLKALRGMTKLQAAVPGAQQSYGLGAGES